MSQHHTGGSRWIVLSRLSNISVHAASGVTACACCHPGGDGGGGGGGGGEYDEAYERQAVAAAAAGGAARAPSKQVSKQAVDDDHFADVDLDENLLPT